MRDPETVDRIEELIRLAGSENIELVFRNRRKQFQAFQRVLLSRPPQHQDQRFNQKVMDYIDLKINSLGPHQEAKYKYLYLQSHSLWKQNQENLILFSRISQLQNMGLLLNGLNLCASCAGFAVVLAKLESMSSDIEAQFEQLQNTLLGTHELHMDFEYDQVISHHMDMLDASRRGQPYPEEKMRELLDQEYNLLKLFLKTLERGLSGNQGQLLFSAFSLLSMFTVCLRSFDELYYFNHRSILGKDCRHLSHDRWMSVYEAFSSPWFIERLQDFAFLEAELSTSSVDMYYLCMLGQVAEAQEDIEDNQALMQVLEEEEKYQRFKELSSREVTESIWEAYQEAGADVNGDILKETYRQAMKLAAMDHSFFPA